MSPIEEAFVSRKERGRVRRQREAEAWMAFFQTLVFVSLIFTITLATSALELLWSWTGSPYRFWGFGTAGGGFALWLLGWAASRMLPRTSGRREAGVRYGVETRPTVESRSIEGTRSVAGTPCLPGGRREGAVSDVSLAHRPIPLLPPGGSRQALDAPLALSAPRAAAEGFPNPLMRPAPQSEVIVVEDSSSPVLRPIPMPPPSRGTTHPAGEEAGATGTEEAGTPQPEKEFNLARARLRELRKAIAAAFPELGLPEEEPEDRGA